MACLVEITLRAERDFAEIYEALAAGQSNAARRWYIGLKSAILGLEELPHRCPIVRKRGRIRQFLYGHKPHVYLVLFRVLEKENLVQVLHIRHGARRKFKPSDVS